MFVTAITREDSVASRDGCGGDQPRTVDPATCRRGHVTLACSPTNDRSSRRSIPRTVAMGDGKTAVLVLANDTAIREEKLTGLPKCCSM